MNIYIPKHIRNIGVVSKMCELIDAYNESGVYVDSSLSDSFKDYYYYLKIDPVFKFLGFCIPESENYDYTSVISYLSRMFYSVKGTYQVLDYMGLYLGLGIRDIKYTVKNLSFTIPEITLTDIDENVFYDALVDFLEALLYFKDLKIKIETVNLQLENTLYNHTGARVVTYKKYTAKEYPTTVTL